MAFVMLLKLGGLMNLTCIVSYPINTQGKNLAQVILSKKERKYVGLYSNL